MPPVHTEHKSLPHRRDLGRTFGLSGAGAMTSNCKLTRPPGIHCRPFVSCRSSLHTLVEGVTVQLRDADVGLCTADRKLNGGLDVTDSLASTIMPGPMSLYELRRWAVAKWLAVEQSLRFLVRQLLCQTSSLNSRQRACARFGAAASKQNQCEGN